MTATAHQNGEYASSPCAEIHDFTSDHRSSAFDILESRLGRGWKSAFRRCWCEEGRISAARALFTRSPSTVPIRTSEFVIADRLALSRFDGEEITEERLCCKPLWRLQRNDPGCVVGEHMQVLRPLAAEQTTESRDDTTEKERPEEIGRSREKRTDGAARGDDPRRFTRVGEVDRVKQDDEDREEKLDDEAPNPVTEDDAADEEYTVEQNRPDGEIDL